MGSYESLLEAQLARLALEDDDAVDVGSRVINQQSRPTVLHNRQTRRYTTYSTRT